MRAMRMRHRAWLRRLRTLVVTMCALAVGISGERARRPKLRSRWSVS
jgi:hypothetical protein